MSARSNRFACAPRLIGIALSLAACTGGEFTTEAASSAAGPGEVPKKGLLLWLRADTGIDAPEGRVDHWLDQSGHGNDAVAFDDASRPTVQPMGLHGMPAIDFDGLDDFLVLPSGFDDFSLGLSMFAVVVSTTDAACPPILQ